MSLAEPYGVDVSTMSSKGFPEMYYGQSQSQLTLPASYLSLAAWSYFTWRGLWALLSFGAFIWVFLVSALMYLISEKTNGLQSIGNNYNMQIFFYYHLFFKAFLSFTLEIEVEKSQGLWRCLVDRAFKREKESSREKNVENESETHIKYE